MTQKEALEFVKRLTAHSLRGRAQSLTMEDISVARTRAFKGADLIKDATEKDLAKIKAAMIQLAEKLSPTSSWR